MIVFLPVCVGTRRLCTCCSTGYTLIERTPTGLAATLNYGSTGLPWMICVKRAPAGSDEQALTDLELLWTDFGDKPSEVGCALGHASRVP